MGSPGGLGWLHGASIGALHSLQWHLIGGGAQHSGDHGQREGPAVLGLAVSALSPLSWPPDGPLGLGLGGSSDACSGLPSVPLLLLTVPSGSSGPLQP